MLGYYQHHGGNNEYSYRDLFRRMDKIFHSDKPHCTVTPCACGLYWNPMLCERLEGRTGILLADKIIKKILFAEYIVEKVREYIRAFSDLLTELKYSFCILRDADAFS